MPDTAGLMYVSDMWISDMWAIRGSEAGQAVEKDASPPFISTAANLNTELCIEAFWRKKCFNLKNTDSKLIKIYSVRLYLRR